MVILNGEANGFLSLSDISPEWVVDATHFLWKRFVFCCVCVCVYVELERSPSAVCVQTQASVCVFVCFSLIVCVSVQGPVIYAQLDHSGSKNSFHKMEPVVYADIRKN